jgi:hypothetical protein
MSILNRSLRFSFNLQMTEENAAQMARAINKVDEALGERGGHPEQSG